MKTDIFPLLIVFVSLNVIIGIDCSKENIWQEKKNMNIETKKSTICEANDTIIQKKTYQKGNIDKEINKWFKDVVRKKIDYNRNCTSNVSRDSIDKLTNKYIKLFKKFSYSDIIRGPVICDSNNIDMLLEGIILGSGVINKQLLLWLPLGCKKEFPHQEKIDSIAKANIDFCSGMVLDDVRSTWKAIYKYRKLPLKDFLKGENCNPLDTLLFENMDKYDLIHFYYLSCERFGWI